MNTRILCSLRPHLSRLAYIEKGVLKDLFYSQNDQPSRVGDFYKGKISRVPKGLNFVFVDLSLKKSGFLYKTRKGIPSSKNPFTVGQEVLVQVVADPVFKKGSRLTNNLSFSGRYLVYLPNQNKKHAISRRIESEKARERLTRFVKNVEGESGAVIVRTLAENASEEELKAELEKLKAEHQALLKAFQEKPKVGELQKGLSVELNYLKNFMGKQIDEIVVDNQDFHKEIKAFVDNQMPEFSSRVKLFSKRQSLFEHFKLDSQIQQALKKRVPFKGGGFLIIEELEAFNVVDVNTGRIMGDKDPEKTILACNLEAARALAEQVRLRNLSGIILVDFIDMEETSSKEKVVSETKKQFADDKAHPRVYPMSELGLLQITRKRTRPSLSFFNSQVCQACHGEGRVKSPSTLATEIFIKLEKLGSNPWRYYVRKKQKYKVFCHLEVKKWIEKQAQDTVQFFQDKWHLYPEFISQTDSPLESYKIEKSTEKSFDKNPALV